MKLTKAQLLYNKKLKRWILTDEQLKHLIDHAEATQKKDILTDLDIIISENTINGVSCFYDIGGDLIKYVEEKRLERKRK